MKHTTTIKQNHEFRRLYYRGKSSGNGLLVLYVLKNRRDPDHNRIGLTVSTKLGGAVVRNRAAHEAKVQPDDTELLIRLTAGQIEN